MIENITYFGKNATTIAIIVTNSLPMKLRCDECFEIGISRAR